jgi:ankyrin repeat protein
MPEIVIGRSTLSRNTPENNINISAALPKDNQEIEKRLNDLADALFESASEPSKGQNRQVIKFTTPTGITGTIESSSPFNSQQKKLIKDAGLTYEQSENLHAINEKATQELFSRLNPSRAEQGDLSDTGRMQAASTYGTISSFIKASILPSGADTNAIEEKTGKLPLQIALERETKLNFFDGVESNNSIIPALLEYGADPHKKNDRGESPMDTAKRLGRDDVVDLFKKHTKDRHSSLEQSPMQNALARAGDEMGSSLHELKDYQRGSQENSTEIGQPALQPGGKGKSGPRTFTV